MKKSFYFMFQLFVGLLLTGFSSLQQTPFRINIHKDFGFSSGNRIRGTFTLAVIGDMEHVNSVTFLYDGEVLHTVSQEPYEYQFKTQSYSLGIHELSALVETKDGSTVSTPSRRFEFVSAEDESAEIQRIVFPLFGGIILLVGVVFAVQWLIFREKENLILPRGAPRHYGILGGTICPKCRCPFSMHWWAPNLGFHKYDRCDFCGRWSIVRRRSAQELKDAEVAELVDSHIYPEVSTSPDHKDETDRLDNTRFVDKI